ncbi:hypothetical protein GCM10023210_04430 [Chryseobacterium ginsengisoli]|uniref:Uncharacterized protein n=1 Tax=Chryseobacterium ginsengisoli TaxID=363853 RepID=A0ABP9LVF5_9FLAO
MVYTYTNRKAILSFIEFNIEKAEFSFGFFDEYVIMTPSFKLARLIFKLGSGQLR